MRVFRFSVWMMTLLAVCGLTTFAAAQQDKLELGDQAPGLDIELWLNSDEMSIENNFTYVVLFFSTTDARVERVVSYVNKIHQNLASEGVRVLGISDDEEDVVRPFVRRLGDQMSFTVAIDRRGATSRNWVGASSIEQTPAVFLVDKRGFIQFMGDPFEQDFDEVLELVVTRRYDARLYQQAQPAIKAINTSRKMRNWRMCLKYLDDLVDTDAYAFAPKVLDKFEILLVDMNEKAQAYEYAREMMTRYATDPELLYWFAEKIVEDPTIPDDRRDLDIALEMVNMAAPQLDPNDPDRYSMEAKVHFHRGELREAVRLQQKAYFTSPPQRKSSFEKVLKTYMEAARPGR